MPADDGPKAPLMGFDAAALGPEPAERPSTLRECAGFYVEYVQAYRGINDIYAPAPLSFLDYRPLILDPEENPVRITSGHNSGELRYIVGENQVPIMESEIGHQPLYLPLRSDIAHLMRQTKGFDFQDTDFFDGRNYKLKGARPASGMVNDWASKWPEFQKHSSRVGRILELGEAIAAATEPSDPINARFDNFFAETQEKVQSQSALSRLFGPSHAKTMRACEDLNSEDWGMLRAVIASEMVNPPRGDYDASTRFE